MTRRLLRWVRPVGAGLLVLAVAFFALQAIATGPFEDLEANQLARDAKGLRIALDGEVALLSTFGASDSQWDDSANEVAASDNAGFAVTFAPSYQRATEVADGVLGVGLDGTPRVGGLATDPNSEVLTPPPAELRDPALLRRMFDPEATIGDGVCGVVGAAEFAYLFCGFASYPSSGSPPAVGGLIYLKSLGPAALTSLGAEVELPLVRVTDQQAGGKERTVLASRLGPITVSTAMLDSGHAVVDAVIPTVNGGHVILRSARDRPIHRVAGQTANWLLLATVIGVLILIGVVSVLLRRAVRQRVRPLQLTAEAIGASGARTLRIGQSGSHE